MRLLWCCLSGMAAPYNDVKRLTLERAWVLMDHTFVCNGQLYKQVDGMGSPLAPALADIFMNHAGPASYSRSDVVQASRSMYETVKLTVMEPLHPHTIKGALAKLKIANRTFQRRRWIAEPEILDPAKLQQFISTHMNMPPQHYAPSLDSPPQQILPLNRFSQGSCWVYPSCRTTKSLRANSIQWLQRVAGHVRRRSPPKEKASEARQRRASWPLLRPGYGRQDCRATLRRSAEKK